MLLGGHQRSDQAACRSGVLVPVIMEEPAGLAGSSLFSFSTATVYRSLVVPARTITIMPDSMNLSCTTGLSALGMSETGYGKIAGMVNDRPDSPCFQVYPVGAEFIARFVRADY